MHQNPDQIGKEREVQHVVCNSSHLSAFEKKNKLCFKKHLRGKAGGLLLSEGVRQTVQDESYMVSGHHCTRASLVPFFWVLGGWEDC